MHGVGQNHIYIRYIYGQNHIYTVFIYGIFSIYTVIYRAYIRFWPTLHVQDIAHTYGAPFT